MFIKHFKINSSARYSIVFCIVFILSIVAHAEQTIDSSANSPSEGVVDEIQIIGTTLKSHGWAGAGDSANPVKGIRLLVDGIEIYSGEFEKQPRPDVAQAKGRSDWVESGWSIKAPLLKPLPDRPQMFSANAILKNGDRFDLYLANPQISDIRHRLSLTQRLSNEWRQFFGLLWLTLVCLVISGPAMLYRGESFVRCVIVLLLLGCWSMLAFFIALLLPGAWNQALLTLAIGIGLASWILRLHRWRRGGASFRFSIQSAMFGIVALGCYILPVIVAGPDIGADDPFSAAQNHYRGMPIDNRIPWILAEASLNDTYKSPLFGDWLGSDRPPLQSGWIILMQPVLWWLPPEVGAFVSSCAAQGLWIVGAIVLMCSVGLKSSSIKCALSTATISGLVLINGIFTWPKLMSTGFLLASAGILFQYLLFGQHRQRCSWSSLALAGSLAGFAMQCHGSAAFAILPLGAFLFFRNAWQLSHPRIIIRNGLAFGICFICLQIPWALWQNLGDPPGDRLVKWHIGGVMSVDNRSVRQTIIESYKNLDWENFLKNKKENIKTLFKPINLAISPWLALENRDRALNTDFYGVFPSMSWALPSWLGLMIIWIYDQGARSTLRFEFSKLLPPIFWVLMTASVWVILMFIPGSTINHQGPMNLSMVGLLFSGVALSLVSLKSWFFTVLLQASGVLWVYFGLNYNVINEFLWFFAMSICVLAIVFASIFPTINNDEKKLGLRKNNDLHNRLS